MWRLNLRVSGLPHLKRETKARRLREHATSAAAKGLVPVMAGMATLVVLITPRTGRLDGPPEVISFPSQSRGMLIAHCLPLKTRPSSKFLHIHFLLVEPQSDFELSDTNGCNGLPSCVHNEITPTKACGLQVDFDPTDLGNRSADLIDSDPDTGNRTIAILSGEGISGNGPPGNPCSLSVDPGTIHQGESSALRWTAPDRLMLDLSGFGEVVNIGNEVVHPPETTTYTLMGKNGKDACASEVTLRVVPGPQPAPTPIHLGEQLKGIQSVHCILLKARSDSSGLHINDFHLEGQRDFELTDQESCIESYPNIGLCHDVTITSTSACRLAVVFTPAELGIRSARLLNSDPGAGNTTVAVLDGVGTALPKILSFGTCPDSPARMNQTAVDLCYRVKDATAISLAPSGAEDLDPNTGSVRVDIDSRRPITYTLTAVGSGGESMSSVVIGPVAPPPASMPKIKRFEARRSGTCVQDKASLGQRDSDSFDLCYEVERADHVEISPSQYGGELDPAQGGIQVTSQLGQSTVYTLTARNKAGQMAVAALTLGPARDRPRNARIVIFEQSTSEICRELGEATLRSAALTAAKQGDAQPTTFSILRYLVEDATQWSVAPGFSELHHSCPGYECQGCLEVPAVTTDTKYVLVAKGLSGQQSTQEITLNPARVEILHFSADETEITRGQQVALRYKTQNAQRLKLDSVEIDPIHGRMNVCAVVSPTTTTTYRLVAVGFDGVSVSDEVRITVLPPPVFARAFDWLKSSVQEPKAVELKTCGGH